LRIERYQAQHNGKGMCGGFMPRNHEYKYVSWSVL
jgi:hypothetical protein